MTVYVDEPVDWGSVATARGLPSTVWAHLTADTRDELHSFARRLGLRRSWFQDDPLHWHYDVTAGKRWQAIRLGAVEVDIHGMAEVLNRRASEPESGQGSLF